MRALQRAGFEPARTPGSHLTMEKREASEVITTVIPLGRRELPRGTLRGILRLARLTQDDFRRHLRS
ncbi:MAG: type II toxin-antitoxin system HicA family toxin [Chloroflexi bacterium]|nr:type II toxin-antitoxin system HicA family toxin [Chloroflexota bacterium]